MFVSHNSLNSRYMTMAFCRWRSERKQCCLAEEEARAVDETSITSYGIPLSPVTSFKCLGRIIMVEDEDWPAVVSNLRKSRRKW